MAVEHKVEALYRALSRNDEWIKFADAKAGAILALMGVLVALTADGFTTATSERLGAFGNEARVAAFLALGAALVAVVYAVRTVLPITRIYADSGAHPPPSLLFFMNIAEHGHHREYLKQWDKLDDLDSVIEEVGQQVWASGRVAKIKYARVILATKWATAALIIDGIAVVLALTLGGR